jgi:hypothetical protein
MMNRKVVVANQSEKKARSVVPNFLKPKKRLSVHLGRDRTTRDQMSTPSSEKYDLEAQTGREIVISALASDSNDRDSYDFETKSPEGGKGNIFARNSEGRNSDGRNSEGSDNKRRSTLQRDVLSPELKTALNKRVEDALLTSLDQPSYSGGGTIADLRLTPAYSVALKANEDALVATANILGEDHPDVIQRKISTADVYKGLGMMREAADMLGEVMDCQRRARTTNNEITPQLLLTLNELGLIYTSLGR